ncbi:MAG: lactonase family protein [Chitinophagaceae bacterium]
MKKVLFILFCIVCCTLHAQTNHTLLFVGTYTDSKPDKGIYVFSQDEASGKLQLLATGADITNPSYLNISPNGKYLYACTDTKTLLPGSVSAFAIDSNSGSIRFINKVSSIGANPVYVAVDKSNKYIVTGNYTGGSVAVFSANDDGAINPAIQSIQFYDSSINKERQEKSHIHSTIFSPDYNFLYLPDLGADKIRAFAFNTKGDSVLQIKNELTVKTKPGTGPRHMVFHPSKKFAYCIEEMGGRVAVYNFNKGKLGLVQTIASNQTKKEEYSSADIHISPDGLFLYASNRLENTISIFSIAASGQLKLLGHQSTLGEVPRNFTIDPSGSFLLVANQSSNNIVVFKRDIKTGLLKATGMQVTVPAPSCLQMRTYKQ